MKIPFFNKKEVKPMRTGAMLRPNRVMPEHGRILANFSRKMMRMYDASITTNLNADFPISITSANAEILTSVSGVRSRARRLERDNPYGKAILETIENNVGGDDPFRLEMRVGKYDASGKFIEERETNRLIEDAWEEAGLPENCTVRRDTSRLEMDLQAIASVVRDGGILFRHQRAYPKNKFGYAIEPIENDRLDHYWARPQTGNQPEIQFSIEMDEWHAPVAYHILTRHPGDVFAYSSQPKYRERVPAEDIIHLCDLRSRAGQYITVSRFSSIIQRLHRIDQFDIAHVTAAIWAACKPFFITQEFPTAMGDMVPDFVKDAVRGAMEGEGLGIGEGEKLSTVEPGTGEVLPYGQKPVLVDPKFPIEAAAGFKKDNLRAAAAGSGAAYTVIGQDLESVNFSSGRIGLEASRDGYKILQQHLILNYRRPHFNEWLKAAILSGELPFPISRLEEFKKAASFLGRRWDYIQPVQDAQADIMRIESGVTSRDAVIRERGGKGVEHVDSQIASDKACDEAHGLDFSTIAKPTISKGEAGPAQDDEPGKPKEESEAEAAPATNGNGKPKGGKSKLSHSRLRAGL